MPVSVSIELSIPEIKFQSEVFRNRIIDALRGDVVPKAKRLFMGTVQGWEHKPNWSESYVNNADQISGKVWASGANKTQYAYVNFGTNPHPIYPRRAKMLRFQPGYRAATRPGSIISSSKRRFGGFVSRYAVAHPGSEARDFDVQIAERMIKPFEDAMQKATRVF